MKFNEKEIQIFETAKSEIIEKYNRLDVNNIKEIRKNLEEKKKQLTADKNKIDDMHLGLIWMALVSLGALGHMHNNEMGIFNHQSTIRSIFSNISIVLGGAALLTEGLLRLKHNRKIKPYSNAISYTNEIEKGLIKE